MDSGSNGIFAWVGKNCTKAEKGSAMTQAMVCLSTVIQVDGIIGI